MKKILLMTALLGFIFTNAPAQEKRIETNELPLISRAFIQEHFPDQHILVAVKESDNLSHTFEVMLDNQTKLEFSKNGKVNSVSSKSKLPDSLIPASILNYVKTNYANAYITEWEIEKGIQTVELNNDIDLKFSKKGKYMGLDL